MKIKNILCTLGLGAIVATSIGLINHNEVTSAKATEGDKFIFVQIKEAADVFSGDTVVFARDNHFINGLGGNPCFTTAISVGNNTADYSKFNFDTTSAAMFEVESGSESYTYSFKCLRTPEQESDWWLKTSGRYLAYSQGYHEDDVNISTKGDIIFKQAKDEKSSWNVDFDGNGFVYLSYSTETNRYGQENVDNPISVQWTSGYVSNGYFGYFFGESHIRMYKKVNVRESNLDYYFYNPANKTTYSGGEYTDLTGLVIKFTTKDTYMDFYSSYSGEPSFFDALPVVYVESGRSYAPFKWLGINMDFTATVEPDRAEENNYYLDNDPVADLRGTYVLAATYDGVTSILDLSKLNGESDDHFSSGKVVDITGTNNPICDSTYDGESNRVVIDAVANNVVTIVKESDGYYIKVGSDYLAFELRTPEGLASYGYVYRGTKEHSKPVTVDLNNRLVINLDGNKTLACDRNLKKVYVTVAEGNSIQIELYRYIMKSAEYTAMNTFKGSFFTTTDGHCDPTGDNNNLNLSDWQDLAAAFNDLSVDIQSYLASLTYSHNMEEAHSLKDMVDRYDLIVSKYASDGFVDFMSRGDAGTLQAFNANINRTFVNNNNNNSAIVAIIVLIAAIPVIIIPVVIVRKKQRD